MQKLWLFLTIALDIFPFIFLQFLAVKTRLKTSYAKTILIGTTVLIPIFVGFVLFAEAVNYSLYHTTVYRLCLFAVMILFTLIFVRKNYAKSLFVFSLIFPYDAFVLVVGIYLSRFFMPSGAPLFMYSAMMRLFLALLTFPFMLHFFKKQLIPIMNVQDDSIWKYAWPIPATLTLASALYINPYYESVGVSVTEVLVRIVILFSTLAVCILLFKVLKKTQEKAETEGRSLLLLNLQAEQYEKLAKNIQATKAAKHDLRHQLSVISNLCKTKEYQKLNEYVDELFGDMPLDIPILVCDHFAVNAIAAHYIALAREQEIDILFDISIDRGIQIGNTDLCIIIGNCLENAIEACASIPPEERFIKAKAKQFHNTLSITFDNSFDGTIKKTKRTYLSKKREFQVEGVGISSVQAVVKKYGGQLEIEEKDKVFRVSILL